MGTAAGLLLLVLIIGFLFLARISVYFLGSVGVLIHILSLVIFSGPWKGIDSDGAFVAFIVVVVHNLNNMIGISMIIIIILMILLLLLLVLRILSTAVVGEGAAFYADV